MITNQELIATLIVKTGLDEQTVKGQLLAWQKEVSSALDRGEEVELHGVGVLKPHGERLEFTPDTQIAHEVNFKYVGLAEVVQQMPEDPSKEVPKEFEKDVPKETPKDSQQQIEPSEGQAASTPDLEQTEPSKTSSTSNPSIKPTASTKEDRPFDQGSPLRWVAAIVVLAAAFTLLLWQLPIQRPSFEETMAESQSQESPLETESESTMESENAPLPKTDAESESRSASDPETTQESDAGQQTTSQGYGLMGPYNASLKESYTIVLYSLSNQDNAVAQRDELRDQSYRAFAREKQLNSGTMTTQVCVGQFERFEDAVRAADASFGEAGINFFISAHNISAHSQAILE